MATMPTTTMPRQRCAPTATRRPSPPTAAACRCAACAASSAAGPLREGELSKSACGGVVRALWWAAAGQQRRVRAQPAARAFRLRHSALSAPLADAVPLGRNAPATPHTDTPPRGTPACQLGHAEDGSRFFGRAGGGNRSAARGGARSAAITKVAHICTTLRLPGSITEQVKTLVRRMAEVGQSRTGRPELLAGAVRVRAVPPAPQVDHAARRGRCDQRRRFLARPCLPGGAQRAALLFVVVVFFFFLFARLVVCLSACASADCLCERRSSRISACKCPKTSSPACSSIAAWRSSRSATTLRRL